MQRFTQRMILVAYKPWYLSNTFANPSFISIRWNLSFITAFSRNEGQCLPAAIYGASIPAPCNGDQSVDSWKVRAYHWNVKLAIFEWVAVSLQWRHNGRDGVWNHSLTIVYATVYLGADQRKHQSSASLAFVWRIHRWPVIFPAQMASKAEKVSIW